MCDTCVSALATFLGSSPSCLLEKDVERKKWILRSTCEEEERLERAEECIRYIGKRDCHVFLLRLLYSELMEEELSV